MHKITPKQCRAARGLLGWSQQNLSEKAGVSKNTIVSFEREKRTPTAGNLKLLKKTLEEHKVYFIKDTGVDLPK